MTRRPDLRALVRNARDRPVVGRAMRLLDRGWWAWTIARAGVVDADYVSAQLGRRVTTVEAVLRYVWRGYRQGLRLNPLFVDTAVGDHLPEAHRVPALYAYLVADPRGLSISPAWNATAYLERHPQRAAERGGALGAVWHRRESESVPVGPDARVPGPPWTDVHRAALDAAAQARTGHGATVGGVRRVGGGEVEYVIELDADEWDFDESIGLAAELAGDPGAVVTLLHRGGRIEDWVQSTLLAATTANVRAVREGHEAGLSWAALRDGADGATVVWRGRNQDVDAATMRALADAAAGGDVVGPLWLDADGTIAAAGAAAGGRLLAGHPAEDGAGLPGAPDVRPPALAGSTFAAPRDLAFAVESDGHDRAASVGLLAGARSRTVALRTDLVARTRSPAPRADLPDALADGAALLRAAGWQTASGGPSLRITRPPRHATLPDGTEVPVLRWALQTAAPVGPRGEWWGDVHFARALADALRRVGQEVVVDAYPARHRPTQHLDDVTIALRGPEPLEPTGHGVSILWIISHPDQITATAARGFDLVYAASTPWAARASEHWGRPVAPLLQCTDAHRFRPSGRPRGSDIVFVGTARGIYRPSVVEPVRAGLPVRVFGPDWRGWIPAAAIAGTGVRNEDLPPLYESAAVVLNDHWPSMQREGFIANRPYDVVAAGGRVISDDVAGIDEVFEGAVLTYRSTDELLTLLTSDLDAAFPPPARLAEISHTVRTRDSFDARARTLLHDVIRARS